MAILDTIRNQLTPNNSKARDQLDILKKAAKGELDVYRNDLIQKIRNPEAFREEIVPFRMFQHMEQYRVSLDEGASKEIAAIVDDFFEGEKGLKDGFKNLINFAFKAILGSTQAGKSPTKNWYVTLEHGALIRVDVMSWRYNFSAEGVISTCKNAFCFTATKSFVDTTDLRSQELVYFIARSLKLDSIEDIMKNENLKQYVKYLQDGFKPKALRDSILEYSEKAGRPLRDFL